MSARVSRTLTSSAATTTAPVSHAEIKQRVSASYHLPSYIPSKTFALALIDVLRRTKPASEATGARETLVSVREAIDKIQNPDLQRTLRVFCDKATLIEDRLDQEGTSLSESIEDWFNDRMSRVSGWYKRRAQIIGLLLGAGLTILTNADTVHVATVLWHDSTLREAVVADAQAYIVAHSPPSAPTGATTAQEVTKRVDDLWGAGFPIGWADDPLVTKWSSSSSDWLALLIKLGGWLLTALALSLGAGFWFDVLSKVLQLRGTGPKVSAATGETNAAAT